MLAHGRSRLGGSFITGGCGRFQGSSLLSIALGSFRRNL